MEWYKLVFEQIQPVHIGKFNWGVVSETEIFIPGQTMWGALVNAYLQKNKLSSSVEIETIQKKFEIITNFFPSFDGENILEPAYENGEFVYKINGKTITEEEFRLYFVNADFKTAIDPFTTTAKEEQLYEFEYILPKPKKEFQEENLGFKEKLYWIGLIRIENGEIKHFLENKPEIFIGGDTRYGYGLIKIGECKEGEGELESWNLNNNGEFNHNNKHLRNFLEFENGIKFKGKIKLIPELEFTYKDPYVKNARFFINIGSKVERCSGSFKLIKGQFIKS